MQTTPEDWKAHLERLGFEFGGRFLIGVLDIADGTVLCVGCGYGSWSRARPSNKKERFRVEYGDDRDRETYPDGHIITHRKFGQALCAWLAVEFCKPMGLTDCVPAKHRILSESEALTLLQCSDPRFRQWAALNLWRIGKDIDSPYLELNETPEIPLDLYLKTVHP